MNKSQQAYFKINISLERLFLYIIELLRVILWRVLNTYVVNYFKPGLLSYLNISSEKIKITWCYY